MSKKRIHEFEEQGVKKFVQTGSDIFLELDCMNHDTGNATNAAIKFSGISNLRITGDLTPVVGMLRENGENIHFEVNGQHCLLIMVWREAKKGASSATNVYNFDFTSMQINRH